MRRVVGIALCALVPFSCLNDLDERDLKERGGEQGGAGGTDSGASGESDGSGGTSGNAGNAGKGGSGKGGTTTGGGAEAGETGSGGSAGSTTGTAGEDGGSGATGGSSVTGGSSGDSGTGGATAGTGGSGGAGGSTAGASGSAGDTSAGGSAGNAGTGGVPGTSFDCNAPSDSIPPIKLTPIATATRPVQLKAAPGDDTRLYVVEHRGRIRVIKDGALLSTPFLDLASSVKDPGANGEHGLLGLVFHPEYVSNGRFFVSYNRSTNGNFVVEEYQRSNDADVASTTVVATLFDEPKPFPNHNGGALEFSPSDGYLYIGVGDGGGSGDPMENAQALDVLLGKILRVDVNTGAPFTIPSGNYPGAAEEIWAAGVRNPWRFTFDPCHGDLYLADTGQNDWEEVNVARSGESGLNFGWNALEGSHCFVTNCQMQGMTMPVHEYAHDAASGSVIGGYVYRGAAISGLRGYYVFGDFSRGTFGAFRWNRDTGAAATPLDLTPNLGTLTGISSFGQDNHGELYVLSVAGSVNRIDPE